MTVAISPLVDQTLAQMGERWPDMAAAIAASPPVWKDSLVSVDAGWGSSAALAMGWLEHASSALVSANIAAGTARDDRSAYADLLAKIEQLMEEVSSPDKGKGFMDNLHFFRRVDRRPPAERLQSLLDERKALDQSGSSRLVGLRDAMEMRELARVAIAGLSDAAPQVSSQIDALDRAWSQMASNSELPALEQQQAARSGRMLQRAKGAFNAVRDRFDGEFATKIAGLEELDEAVRMEESTHARIDASLGKLTALVAGLQVAQVAQRNLPVLPAPVATQEPAKRGFLARLGLMREASGEGGLPETIKATRQMAGAKEIGEKEWKSLVKMLADPSVGPSTAIGDKSLLETLMVRDVSTKVPSQQFVTTVLMLAMSDGGAQLRKCPASTVSSWCDRLVGGGESRLDYDDDDWDMEYDEEAMPRSDYGMPTAAAKFWVDARLPQRRSFHGNLRFCLTLRKHEADYPSLAEASRDIFTAALSAASPQTLEEAMSNDWMAPLLREAVKDMPEAQRSIVLRAELMRGLKDGEPMTRASFNRAQDLDPASANEVARNILLSHRADTLAVSVFDGAKWSEVDEPDIRALRQFSSVFSLTHSTAGQLSSWPRDLAASALAHPDLRLLHAISDVLSEVPVGLSPGAPLPYHPLVRVMELDGASPVLNKVSKPGGVSKGYNHKEKTTTGTNPERWCGLLAEWKDVPALRVPGPVERWEPEAKGYPGMTPLMLAASSLNTPWIGALRAAGADETLPDKMGRTAMDHWLQALEQMPLNSKSTVSRITLKLNAMDQASWWGLVEMSRDGTPLPMLVGEVLSMPRGDVDDKRLLGREQAIVHAMTGMDHKQLVYVLGIVSMNQVKGQFSCGMEQAMELARRAGHAVGGQGVEELRQDVEAWVKKKHEENEAYSKHAKYQSEKMKHQMMMEKVYSKELAHKEAMARASRIHPVRVRKI